MNSKLEGFNIILEGCDGVGKTTVAARMCREGQMHLAIHQNAPKTREEAEKYYRSGLKIMNSMDYIIFDRFTLSERVYAPIFRNYTASYLDELEKKILSHNYLFLLDSCTSVVKERYDGKMISENQIPLILRKYRIAYTDCKYPRKACIDTENLKPYEIVEIIMEMIESDRRE